MSNSHQVQNWYSKEANQPEDRQARYGLFNYEQSPDICQQAYSQKNNECCNAPQEGELNVAEPRLNQESHNAAVYACQQSSSDNHRNPHCSSSGQYMIMLKRNYCHVPRRVNRRRSLFATTTNPNGAQPLMQIECYCPRQLSTDFRVRRSFWSCTPSDTEVVVFVWSWLHEPSKTCRISSEPWGKW